VVVLGTGGVRIKRPGNSPIVENRADRYEGWIEPIGAGNRREGDLAIPRKVFVGNLSFNTTQDRLREAFTSAGQVVSVHIGTDRETGRSRGFAFVEFSSDEEAQKAISSFNESDLDGRKLRVNAAEDRPPRRAGAPSGGGYSAPRSFTDFNNAPEESGGGFGGGFGKPFHKPKGSRRGLRARKRSLG
jgi:cold-inducible RNA-binding protein